jgi:hypothetical protein
LSPARAEIFAMNDSNLFSLLFLVFISKSTVRSSKYGH